jgi:hypothetical protein
MTQAHRSIVFAAFLLAGIPVVGQEAQRIPSIFGDLSPEQMNAINESRRLASGELIGQSPAFETPNIAGSLEARWYLIAIAKIIGVQLPDGANSHKTIVRFHVEQLIQGDGPVADLTWNLNGHQSRLHQATRPSQSSPITGRLHWIAPSRKWVIAMFWASLLLTGTTSSFLFPG